MEKQKELVVKVQVEVNGEDGRWAAQAPEIGGAVVGQGTTPEQAVEDLCSAIAEHIVIFNISMP